ncbi:MAG: ABC transporter permease [Oscillospiraceae bacterium]|nr:ABC transporter permease [Oscillospiraceae bacterium]
MNMYKREMKAHWKGFVIWLVVMAAMVAVCMNKFTAGTGSASGSMTEIIDQMPAVLHNLFGIGVFDLNKALDYYGMVFLYIALLAAVHAAMLGASMLSKEERDKTIEFLAVKPVTRGAIITAKLCAGLTVAVGLNLITLVTSLALVGQYQSGSEVTNGILALMAGMFGIQLIFLSVGTVCAACMKKGTRAGMLSMVIMLVTFFLSILIQLAGNIDFMKVLSPFEYFDAKEILKGGTVAGINAFSVWYLVLTVAVIASCLVCSYVFYKRRDYKI